MNEDTDSNMCSAGVGFPGGILGSEHDMDGLGVKIVPYTLSVSAYEVKLCLGIFNTMNVYRPIRALR